MIISIGEDSPSQEDIENFGLYNSCQRTHGNFALYDQENGYAARGRVGTSPLYWNKSTRTFSFRKTGDIQEEFPEGHLYDTRYDRLVCWDDLYFDKPLETRPDAVYKIEILIENAINFLIPKTDAFLKSSGCGSRIISAYMNSDKPSYTVAFDVHAFDVPLQEDNGTTLYFDNSSTYPKHLGENEVPMYVLARYLRNTTSHRKFICGLGCFHLFSGSPNFKPYIEHVVNQFSEFGLEVYSPFLDSDVIEYVMDMTTPEDREIILDTLLAQTTRDVEEDEFLEYGHEIHESVGFAFPKKKWWYW
jgi:asparagine synthetase B (glutamine-hydrolysing)